MLGKLSAPKLGFLMDFMKMGSSIRVRHTAVIETSLAPLGLL